MAKTKSVWGIDLGQCALKAICLRAVGDKVEAVDHAYVEHGKILSQPGVEQAELIAESMKKFLEKHDLSGQILVVGVPGQHTLARFTKLPPVDKKKIPEIVKYEAQQQIHFDVEEVVWDYQTFENPEAMETEVGIFAMRRELMREHLKFLSDLNLEPAIVQSSPLALYNALKYDGLCGSEPVVILDIGAQNTDLLAVDGNSLWTRNIPIGGNAFTEVLVKTFKLSFHKAENLKRSAGSSKYARQVFQAMRPVFADLVAEVQRSIGFYTQSRRGVKLTKMVAMGNAFRLPGMPKFIQQNLGMEVFRPTTFSRLSASGAPNAPQLMDQLLSFAVAYGLAVQGLGLAQITSNLLPPEIAKQVVWQKKMPWFYGAAACLALSAGLIWARNLSDMRAVAAGAGEGDGSQPPLTTQAASRILEAGPGPGLPPKDYARQVLAAAQFLNNVKAEAESKIETQIASARQIEKLQADKVVWPRILNMIHSALPAPDPEIARAIAEGPQALKTLVASDPVKYERAKRRQIFIQQFKSEYSAEVVGAFNQKINLGSPAGAPMAGGGPGGASAEPLFPGPSKSGFVVTLVCQTPFAGGNREAVFSFIQKVFMANLQKAARKEQGVYIEQIHLGPAIAIGELKARAASSGGRPGVRTGGLDALAASDAREELIDPVTGESTSKDWQFELTLTVVVGEKPAAPAGEPAGAPEE